MAKKRSGTRDKAADVAVLDEIRKPGASLDDLLPPLDEAFFDGPLVSWHESVLDDVLKLVPSSMTSSHPTMTRSSMLSCRRWIPSSSMAYCRP